MNSELNIIAAVTRDLAIGRGGDMPYHISGDLRRFKELTMGHPVIMGRKTFQSLPKGALPGRRNLVVSRNAGLALDGAEVFGSLTDAMAACSGGPTPFVIGGGEIYRQAMPLATRLFMTQIDATVPDADTWFPAIEPAQWAVDGQPSDWQTDNRSGVKYRFINYIRKQD